MARSVLAWGRLWAAALVLVVAPLAGRANPAQQPDSSPKHSDCSSTTNPDVSSLQKSVKAGPFYNELLHQLGEPLSCSLQVDDGRIQLTYAFPDAAQLVAQVNRNIEYSEQRMQVTRMEASKALELLKAADKDAYPPNGCGIAWAHPEKTSHGGPGGTREVIYRGDVCNCQARVTYRNNYAVSLALKSAC